MHVACITCYEWPRPLSGSNKRFSKMFYKINKSSSFTGMKRRLCFFMLPAEHAHTAFWGLNWVQWFLVWEYTLVIWLKKTKNNPKSRSTKYFLHVGLEIAWKYTRPTWIRSSESAVDKIISANEPVSIWSNNSARDKMHCGAKVLKWNQWPGYILACFFLFFT